jgi:hypothetical protein
MMRAPVAVKAQDIIWSAARGRLPAVHPALARASAADGAVGFAGKPMRLSNQVVAGAEGVVETLVAALVVELERVDGVEAELHRAAWADAWGARAELFHFSRSLARKHTESPSSWPVRRSPAWS